MLGGSRGPFKPGHPGIIQEPAVCPFPRKERADSRFSHVYAVNGRIRCLYGTLQKRADLLVVSVTTDLLGGLSATC